MQSDHHMIWTERRMQAQPGRSSTGATTDPALLADPDPAVHLASLSPGASPSGQILSANAPAFSCTQGGLASTTMYQNPYHGHSWPTQAQLSQAGGPHLMPMAIASMPQMYHYPGTMRLHSRPLSPAYGDHCLYECQYQQQSLSPPLLQPTTSGQMCAAYPGQTYTAEHSSNPAGSGQHNPREAGQPGLREGGHDQERRHNSSSRRRGKSKRTGMWSSGADVPDEMNTEDWLKEIRLHKYTAELRGYTRWELLDMPDDQFNMLPMTDGGRRKLRKDLANWARQKELPVPFEPRITRLCTGPGLPGLNQAGNPSGPGWDYHAVTPRTTDNRICASQMPRSRGGAVNTLSAQPHSLGPR